MELTWITVSLLGEQWHWLASPAKGFGRFCEECIGGPFQYLEVVVRDSPHFTCIQEGREGCCSINHNFRLGFEVLILEYFYPDSQRLHWDDTGNNTIQHQYLSSLRGGTQKVNRHPCLPASPCGLCLLGVGYGLWCSMINWLQPMLADIQLIIYNHSIQSCILN